MSCQGTKFDTAKLRYDLLPPDALEGLVKVLTFGADKYGDRNWEAGIDYGRVFGAAQRHLWAFWAGEDLDPETGLCHLAHAATNCMFLLAYWLREMDEYDNRKVSVDDPG